MKTTENRENKPDSDTASGSDHAYIVEPAPVERERATHRLSATTKPKQSHSEPNVRGLRDIVVSLRQIANMIDAMVTAENQVSNLLSFERREGSWQDAMDSGEAEE